MYSIYLLLFTGIATMINSRKFIELITRHQMWKVFCEVPKQDDLGNNRTGTVKSEFNAIVEYLTNIYIGPTFVFTLRISRNDGRYFYPPKI